MRGTLGKSVVAAAFAGALTGGAAMATPVISGCTTVYSFPSGDGSVKLSQLTAGVCVLSQDKLYKNFVNGVSGANKLPSGMEVSFNLDAVLGYDVHTISFNNSGTSAFHSNNMYKWSYEIEVYPTSPTGPTIVDYGQDFSQSSFPAGVSTLTDVLKVVGTSTTQTLVEQKTGASGSSVDYAFSPGIIDLLVSNTLVDHGSITSVENTVVEKFVPEPASLLLLGGALAGFGAARRKKRS